MKKFAIILAGLAGLAASPALATPNISLGGAAASFGNGSVYCGMSASTGTVTSSTSAAVPQCSFTDTITFTTALPFNLISGTISTTAAGGVGSTGDINFTSVMLDGMAFSVTSLFGGIYEIGTLGVPSPIALSVGSHTLTITGTTWGSSAGLDGSYGGNLNFTQAVTQSGVPEPATWLSMILGFGVIGLGLRRSVQPVRRVNYNMA